MNSTGAVKIRLNRYVPTTVVLGLDMSSWSLDFLRPFQTIDIAKVGDAERRMLLAEYALVCKTPTANFKVTAVT